MNSFLNTISSNLLTVKQSDNNVDPDRKRLTLKLYLYLISSTLFLFTVLHAFVYQDVSDRIFILELIVCLTFVYAIFKLDRHQNTDRIAHFTTFLLALFALIFIEWNQGQDFGLIWFIFVPIVAITINGPKVGLRYSLVFVFILLVIAYDGIGNWQTGLWNEMSFIRLMVASLVLTFVTYISEVALRNARYEAKIATDKLSKHEDNQGQDKSL